MKIGIPVTWDGEDGFNYAHEEKDATHRCLAPEKLREFAERAIEFFIERNRRDERNWHEFMKQEGSGD